MIKPQTYFILFLAGVMTIVFLALVGFSIYNAFTSPQQPSPTPALSPAPTASSLEKKPPVTYDATTQTKLLDKFQNRQTLSENDSFAKAKLLALLPTGAKSGTIHTTKTIRIDYLASPDLFQVEILTPSIDQAKAEAVVWLTSQGLSSKALCDFPIQFYLNFSVAQSLRNKNVTFSPLAAGC